MNELNKIIMPNGTELTLAGGGSDVTAETVRDWGFACESEVNDVEAELARFDLFDWNLLANEEFPTGFLSGYFGRDGTLYENNAWSRTRRTLYRRNQYCVLQSDYHIRVNAYTGNPYAATKPTHLWCIVSEDGTPIRFKTDNVSYFYVSVRQPLDTITTDPPKMYWVFPNTPTVDEIEDSTESGAIPNVGAVKDYVDAHGGGSEVTEQTVAGWGFTRFDGDYNSLSNKPTIPEPVTDAHIIDVIASAFPNAEGVGF